MKGSHVWKMPVFHHMWMVLSSNSFACTLFHLWGCFVGKCQG